jgi:hypothetical protein
VGVTRLVLGDRNAFTAASREFVVRHSRAAGTVILPSVCRHRGGPLNLGVLDSGSVVCPWHDTRTRCPSPASRRSPFVFVRSGRAVTVVGVGAERTYHLPVLEDEAR